MPLICPTCQAAASAWRRPPATLHGVVFDILRSAAVTAGGADRNAGLPPARSARAVELFVDFRAVSGVLEVRAKQFGLFERDRGPIKPAHEFSRRASLGDPRATFGEKHAVPAGTGIETLMCRVEVIQDPREGAAQPVAFLGSERSDGVQHMIDRIVLAQAFLTLRSDAEHDRTLVFVRGFLTRYDLLSRVFTICDAVVLVAPMKPASAVGVRENLLARPRNRSAIHSRSRRPC